MWPTHLSPAKYLTGKKKRLLEIFSGWCDNVIDLLNATQEEAILRRDIYDRPPTMNWGKGRVTLLGDSVHAMQPNLGQGGCMAIEVCDFLVCHGYGITITMVDMFWVFEIQYLPQPWNYLPGWLPTGCRA
jgi:hypothetical protein